MIKKFLFLILFSIIFLLSSSGVLAKNNPADVSNNKFGIHIMDERDLPDASNLVNSSGGDWGYVTFVITEKERDRDRWQKAFDQMRRLHLIPIVRIASKADGGTWTIPEDAEINNWIAFLNSLNWVIQNRYIIIGNEPNHANEWGGKLDPATYAAYLNSFAQKLHQASSDYFVLPAALDASAKNTKDTMDESIFIKKMILTKPDLYNNLDGWTSHSYPNPAFAGKETDTGRGTINTFKWELSLLSSLGVAKELPVFITETGWSNQKINPEDISEKYKYAFNNVWNDPIIAAVTPFILNYPEPPFFEFSWRKNDGTFFPYFDGYKGIAKVKGVPVQIESGQILGALAQPLILDGSDFIGAILAKNTGQSIWTVPNTNVVSDTQDLLVQSYSFLNIEPMKLGVIVFRATPPKFPGLYSRSIFLSNSTGKRITNSFPIEALIVKTTRVQIKEFLDKFIGQIFPYGHAVIK